jgi:hypothetical protein
VGHAVGPPVELRSRERTLDRLDRDRVGSTGRAFLEDLVQPPFTVLPPVRLGPPSREEHLFPLRRLEKREVGDGPVRVLEGRAEEPIEVRGHPLHRLVLEKIGRVLDPSLVTAIRLENRQGEVEDRGPLVDGEGREEGLRSLAGQARCVEHLKRDLEQRVAAQVPLGVQFLDEDLERKVLVRVGLGQHGADAVDEFPERGLSGQIRPEHEGVDEEPDEPLDLGAVPVGDRRPDHDVFLRRVSVEERLHARHQDHERRDPLRLGEFRDPVPDLLPQGQRAEPTPIRLLGGSRVIRGKLEDRQVGELPSPVGEFVRENRALQPLALPFGEIGVLDR